MSTGAYWPGGADSGANVASAASRKPAISCTDSPLMRMASRMPPSSRSETRPSSMAWYKSWASSRVMLRAPFLPRPISLMKRAAWKGVVDMVSVVMALAYTQTPWPFRPAQAKRLTAETIAAHFSYTMCPPKRPPSREASHHDLPRHRKHQRHLLRPDAIAGSAARAAAADRQRVRYGDEGPRGAAQYHRPQGPAPVRRRRAVLDYARRLKQLQAEVADTMLLVMRVYFEKPRTTTGWKGYINDPDMDDSFRVNVGMEKARQFLLDVCELGLPTATEALDPISPQYLGDLIAWTAIGARTTESQTHREMSSGLSTPVGFKNGTDGDISIAVNAILSSSHPHSFLGINSQGNVAIVRTRGNAYGHVVLRGGDGRPNYDSVSIAIAEQALAKAKLPANLVVDCSHANSYKKPELQPLVMADVVNQIVQGNKSLVGVMIESNIVGCNQKIPADLSQLVYGCSVTVGCIDWDTTEKMLRDAAALLRQRP